MTEVPTYTLICESAAAAERFAGILRNGGYIRTDADHGTVTIHWGGPFDGLTAIYDLGRDLGVASDERWSEFLMQAA